MGHPEVLAHSRWRVHTDPSRILVGCAQDDKKKFGAIVGGPASGDESERRLGIPGGGEESPENKNVSE
jgi:hypothetical protein